MLRLPVSSRAVRLQLPLLVEEARAYYFLRRAVGRIGRLLAADVHDRPVAETREEQVVDRTQVLAAEGVAAVDDDVTAGGRFCLPKWKDVRINQDRCKCLRSIALPTDQQSL